VFKFGAVNSNVTVFVWCCTIINTTNGVVKKSKLFELVLLINHMVNFLVLSLNELLQNGAVFESRSGNLVLLFNTTFFFFVLLNEGIECNGAVIKKKTKKDTVK
jgi:hypothetical protein